jgi:hypothetical protein
MGGFTSSLIDVDLMQYDLDQKLAIAREFVDSTLQATKQFRPPIDLRVVTERIGINRVRLAAIEPDAMLRALPTGYEIIIKRDAPRSRQRFSWAHELGHYFLDRPKVGRRAFRGVTYEEVERACDKLAAQMLMPDHMFQYFATEVNYSLKGAANLSKLFETSIVATVRRLAELHPEHCVLTEWSWNVDRDPAPIKRYVLSNRVQSKLHGSPVNNEQPGYPVYACLRSMFSDRKSMETREWLFVVREGLNGRLSVAPELVPTEAIAIGSGDSRRVFTLSYIDRAQSVDEINS